MIDFKPELVEALNTILPTYYEMIVDSSTETPCITYIEIDNSANEEGQTLAYSTITYQIKIWGSNIADMENYAKQLDAVMRSIGFKRTSKNELWHNELGQYIFRYTALALENL